MLQLSVLPDNHAAIGLYQSVGFIDANEMADGEKIFRLALDPEPN